ncbi:MAG: hypothetical protein AB9866_25910 [Syntrophobacteraceae bacterium]
MTRVLVVGWGLPQAATDGASIYLQWLAERYRADGNHVEIFTIARPEKWAPPGGVEPWRIYRQEYGKIPYNVLIRPWGVLYTDPLDPLQSVYEERTRKIWLDFMRSSGGWDIVHFNAINPLEIIECTRKLGCHVRYSFHNCYLLFPIEHIFSYVKFRDNPCSDLTIYEPTSEAAVAEYEALGALDGRADSEKKDLARQFQLRMDYGKYLIDEVVDEVWGSHLRFLAIAREIFGLNVKNSHLFDMPAPQEDWEQKGAEAASKFEQASRVIIAELANIHSYKGQHILVALCDHLREYAGRFEIRFYGGVNDPGYMESLKSSIEKDRFKKEHIRFCGGYLQRDLGAIASKIHVHVSCIPIMPYISGTLLETVPRGVLPVYKEDILLRLLKQKGDHSDILSYQSGNVEQLAQLIRGILDGKLNIAAAYSRTATALFAAESMGIEGLEKG